jgi:class 3 adenylate cyclase
MPNEPINAVFAFIDLIDSTRNATYLSQNQYVDDLLLPFQEVAENLRRSIIGTQLVCLTRGDEIFIRSEKNENEPSSAIRLICEYALVLKAAIHCTKLNRERIDSQRPPFDIGVGIHVGPAVMINGEKGKIEGYSINQAKRVEASSRGGLDSRIILSSSARIALFRGPLEDMIVVTGSSFQYEAKGISGSLVVYELLEFFSNSLFQYIETLVPNFEEHWKSISENLIKISPNNSWANLLWVGYRFYRARKIEDSGVLHAIVEYISTHEALENKLLPNWLRATVELTQEDYVNAFFDFEKCQKISSQRKVVIPKLLSALPLVKQGFFKGGDRIDNLKREVVQMRSELSPGDEAIAKISELGSLLNV